MKARLCLEAAEKLQWPRLYSSGRPKYGGPGGRATRRCLCDDDEATIDDDDATIDDGDTTIDDGDATIDDGDATIDDGDATIDDDDATIDDGIG